MTEPKLPQPGEWWRTRGGRPVLVAYQYPPCYTGGYELCVITGPNDTGSCYMGNGSYWRYCQENIMDLVEHLPNCTGFDWVPESFPQYREAVVVHAFIRRDSPTSAVYVDRDGTETDFGPWEECDWDRTIITESEALSRLTPKVPPCPDCGEPAAEGHADVCPMAWVEITDPAHVLRGTDECNVVDQNDGGWCRCDGTIGKTVSVASEGGGPKYRLKFRCRRKDLPTCTKPAEESTRPADVSTESTRPDPGEGWRLIDKNVDEPMEGDEYWSPKLQRWEPRTLRCEFGGSCFYRRRIEPAKKRIPLRVWVSNCINDNGSPRPLYVTRGEPSYIGAMVEVHGLNAYVEEPS